MLAGEFSYKSIWSLKYIELKYIFVHSKIEITGQSRPPQDVDVLAVLVLGRPNFFFNLTSSDVLVPVRNLVRDVLVLGRPIKIKKSLSSDVLVPVPRLVRDVLVLGRPR